MCEIKSFKLNGGKYNSSIVESPVTTTAEDFKDLALAFANDYVKVNDYKLTIDEGELGYVYRFHRYLGGYETCENLYVGVSRNGEITDFCNRLTNDFNKLCSNYSPGELDIMINSLASKNAKTEVDRRIHSMYSNMTSYDIVNQVIVLLDDVTIGMVYAIEAEFTNGSSSLDYQIVTEE